jgi:hypothetical protein
MDTFRCMGCGDDPLSHHCVRAITQASEPLAPGSHVVDLTGKTVHVDDGPDPAAVAAAIEAAGYPVTASEGGNGSASAADTGSWCGRRRG